MDKKATLKEAKNALGEGRVNNFLASMGFDSNFEPIPYTPPKRQCPKCNGWNAVIREIHPDTGMDEIVGRCRNCGYDGEPREFAKEKTDE